MKTSLVVFVLLKLVSVFPPAETFSLSPLLSAVVKDPIKELVEVTPANIPADLDAIRQCRKEALDEILQQRDSKNLLNSEVSFLNAQAVADGEVVCVVAKEKFFPWRVLGTADVSIEKNKKSLSSTAQIRNVFVRPEEQGRGLGKRIMQGVEDFVLEEKENNDHEEATTATLCLEVSTQNTPAVQLYQKLGYEPPGLNKVTSVMGRQFDLLVEMRKEIGK